VPAPTPGILWLETKNLFQTFELQDEAEIKQEIKEIRMVLDEDVSDQND